MKKLFNLICLSLILGTTLVANTIKVPADQSTIQKAINMAKDGDTILVSPGIYYENVNFNAKKVVLTSYYLYNQDTSFIRRTIIDGSRPSQPDSASCIRILKGQDSTAVVQGFTITGGQGTTWKDEHSGGTYREGGGIIVALSSPTIRNNLIINNFAVNKKKITGCGGGGMRCGDGNPKILNNVIVNNHGNYGGAIVLNYCNATIKNNIIMGNDGGQDYGGGGLWINGGNGGKNNIENNTIVGNYSYSTGGGIRNYNLPANMAILRNNIIYGNAAISNPQVFLGKSFITSYCNIEGLGASGIIDKDPQFEDLLLYLKSSSPCLDAGDTSSIYNDPADLGNLSKALFPSKGGIRNDMGAFGGPGSSLLPGFKFSRIGVVPSAFNFGNNNDKGISIKKTIKLVNQSLYIRSVDSVKVMGNKGNLKINRYQVSNLKPFQTDSIIIEWIPTDNQQLVDTILIYHNTENIAKPIKIGVSGKVKITDNIMDLNLANSIHNYPNPFSGITNITYSLAAYNSSALLTVYDNNGRKVKSFRNLNRTGTIEFDGNSLPQGVYIYRLITPDNKEFTNKMIIMR